MSDSITLQKRAMSLETSPQFENYSKVVIQIDNDTEVSAGDESGRVLTITNPFGTEQMAQDILAKLQGYQYQPYDASGALLDPAAEIGDAVSVGNVYGGIYTRKTYFSRLMSADISAPEDKEINHEYQYESPTERQFSRQIGDIRATLLVQSNEISAKVSNTSIGEDFGWELLSDHWSVVSHGSEIFRVDENGGTFSGKVSADSGKIGGFDIKASAIYNNLQEFGGSQETGVYIGTDGIQLGQAFKVTSYGAVTANNITANNMTLTGTLNIGGQLIAANALHSGAYSAYTNGSYWSGGSGWGYNYQKATTQGSGSYPSYFQTGYLKSGTVSASALIDYNNVKHNLYWRYMQINGTYYYVLCGN